MRSTYSTNAYSKPSSLGSLACRPSVRRPGSVGSAFHGLMQDLDFDVPVDIALAGQSDIRARWLTVGGQQCQ